MLFQRREPIGWREKFRVWIWPRRSWMRSGKYVTKRILRLTASPHAIAAGVAAGVLTSFTPFMGFHFIIAFIIAYIIGGNMIASALGTFFGNPISFPFIWISTYSTGKMILHGPFHQSAAGVVDPSSELQSLASLNIFESGFSGIFQKLGEIWDPILLPMAVGSVPLGVTFGIIAYLLTLWGAKAFRSARIKLISERAEANRIRREKRDAKKSVEETKSPIKKATEKAKAMHQAHKDKSTDKHVSRLAGNQNSIVGE